MFTSFLILEGHHTAFIWSYSVIGFALQLLQYVICVIETENDLSIVFKPFEKCYLPNSLAKIDLSDPNAALDSYFGPPVSIPSVISGQRPVLIRYGSQATKTTVQQPMIVVDAPLMNHQYPINEDMTTAGNMANNAQNPQNYDQKQDQHQQSPYYEPQMPNQINSASSQFTPSLPPAYQAAPTNSSFDEKHPSQTPAKLDVKK